MDKKRKQQRQKNPTRDELEEASPRGASFDTEAGRAAQGMRPDIGSGGGDTVGKTAVPEKARQAADGEQDEDSPALEGAVGVADANSGGGAATGIPDADTAMRTDTVNHGDVEEDRAKLFPDAPPDRDPRERPGV